MLILCHTNSWSKMLIRCHINSWSKMLLVEDEEYKPIVIMRRHRSYSKIIMKRRIWIFCGIHHSNNYYIYIWVISKFIDILALVCVWLILFSIPFVVIVSVLFFVLLLLFYFFRTLSFVFYALCIVYQVCFLFQPFFCSQLPRRFRRRYCFVVCPHSVIMYFIMN